MSSMGTSLLFILVVGGRRQRLSLGSAWNPNWHRLDYYCSIQINGLLVNT